MVSNEKRDSIEFDVKESVGKNEKLESLDDKKYKMVNETIEDTEEVEDNSEYLRRASIEIPPTQDVKVDAKMTSLKPDDLEGKNVRSIK